MWSSLLLWLEWKTRYPASCTECCDPEEDHSRLWSVPKDLGTVHDLLTTYQVARLLGVSRMTVYRAVESGEVVPALKVPGSKGTYLFTPDVIEAWRGQRLFELDGHLCFGVPAA